MKTLIQLQWIIISLLMISFSHAQTTITGPDTVCEGHSTSYFQTGGSANSYTTWKPIMYRVSLSRASP